MKIIFQTFTVKMNYLLEPLFLIMEEICSIRRDMKIRKPWWRHQMETFFRVTGHLCGEFTGHRWIPRTKASGAELWFTYCSAPG